MIGGKAVTNAAKVLPSPILDQAKMIVSKHVAIIHFLSMCISLFVMKVACKLGVVLLCKFTFQK
jgi:hypothetical protein